jgi:hypothetical protein
VLAVSVALCAACDDGMATYPTLATAAAAYLAQVFLGGAAVGVQSEGCTLTVTPRALTYSIWN